MADMWGTNIREFCKNKKAISEPFLSVWHQTSISGYNSMICPWKILEVFKLYDFFFIILHLALFASALAFSEVYWGGQDFCQSSFTNLDKILFVNNVI